ncbi:MAG: BatA and WFA domain-containing protein [Gemmatimonadota bacterium]
MISFLTPLFLLALGVVAAPVLLHLVKARLGEEREFPTLRYLRQISRERARELRLREHLLLAVRMAILAFVVLAGAGLHLGNQGGAHPPTALAIVVDNSASSQRLVGGERVLDRLVAKGLEALERATSQDRIWIIPAGEAEPVVLPMTVEAARIRLENLQPSTGSSRLPSVVARARRVTAASALPASEVLLLSDLQASSLEADTASREAGSPEEASIPVLAPIPDWSLPSAPDLYLEAPLLAGGRVPLAGETAALVVSVREGAAETTGSREAEVSPTEPLVRPVRLFTEGQLRSSVMVPVGEPVVLPLPPTAGAWSWGWVETDPTGLVIDDRRYYAFPLRPPPVVEVMGSPSVFLDQALDVLAESGRIRRAGGTPRSSSQIQIVLGGDGLTAAPPDASGLTNRDLMSPLVVILPLADPLLLPALNRKLAESSFPWRLEAPSPLDPITLDETTPAPGIPSLTGVRMLQRFRLEATGPESSLPDASNLLTSPDGVPWGVIRGDTLLLAIPPDPAWSSLPVSVRWLPFLEGLAAGGWQERGDARWPLRIQDVPWMEAGTPLSIPPGATAVERPDGTREVLSGTQPPSTSLLPGIHRFLAGDSILALVAVNIPLGESLSSRSSWELAVSTLGGEVVVNPNPTWSSSLFRTRHGHAAIPALLGLTLVLLIFEGWIRAGKRGTDSL